MVVPGPVFGLGQLFALALQVRPEQFVVVETDMATGKLTAVNPFRVNTALFGLEFVY